MSSITRLPTRVSGWLRYRLARIKARSSAKRTLSETNAKNILILCYGNIYRSPFVEHYIKNKLGNGGVFNICSAGFHKKTNRKSASEYIELCQSTGVDLLEHRSSLVNTRRTEWADLIIIMDGHNYNMLRMLDKAANSKVVWLGSLSASTPVEIKDPYGCSLEEQKQIIKQLADASQVLCDYLLKAS